jgi:YD repeat-containing protein
MTPMAKILLALVALSAVTSEASAQSRSYYDSSGKRIGSATTASGNTVTNYDSRGRVTSRETTTGNTTTVYCAGGRNIGQFTTNR